MSTEVDRRVPPRSLDEEMEKTKTLICALNLVSRDLPLPPDLLASVSSIFHGADGDVDDDDGGGDGVEAELASSKDVPGISSYGDLIMEFEDALLTQRETCSSGQGLTELRDNRFLGQVGHRLSDLEELPSSRGEDLQTKCLLELYGLKLKALQKKVRSDVSSEYWLRACCACPDKQLYDWGMMRLRDIQYGIGDAFVVEGDDQLRKKRDAERLSRLQDEEKNYMETRKRKFFADLLNAAREINVQVGAALRHRKARNDGVQQWHVKRRQKATKQEKLRIQAIKTRDEETYMKLVNESKNERLTTLLGKTNELLESLGAAVQRQKDAEHSDGTEPSKIDMTAKESVKAGNIFEGQRQYNSAVHSIQEKVTEQPALLQGGELRPYQVEGLQWMVSLFNNNLNGILADEMGLGKTIQTISLIAYLLENKGVTGPHLIVAPKAVLPNWKNEFATWAPTIHTVLYDGRKEERSALQQKYSGEEKFSVFLTHYDLIIRDKKFLKKIHWYYMVVDEGHRLKNHDCTLARTLVSGYKIRRRLLLTGTPIQNSLQELWALLNFLLPNIFNSVDNFEEWFNAPFADRGDVTLTEEEEQLIILRLHHVIRPFILRRKKEEVEKYLPQKTQVILKCDMSAWQKVYYHQITDIGRVGLATASRKSKSLHNLSMQLRKCCNHPYLFVGDPSLWHIEELIRASGKFELLDRLLPKLRRAGHRVLLFSQMTKLLDVLQFYLRSHKYDYLRLDGSSKTEDRGELLKKFNALNSPYFIFLLSTRAGGLGLNLQTADTVIIFDSDWNPQMDQQAEDRAHRIGQTKEVRVFVLVSVGSIEEVILERAKQKMGIDAKVIQAGLFNTTSTAEERRGLLEEIMRKGTSSLGTDVPSEREINRLAARTEEEYWLFERMDEERRLRENYRTRLMEEHEVPDWAYTTPDVNDTKGKGFDYESANITGKRKRKEVGYSDILNDAEWYKAMQSADGTSNSIGKGEKKKKKEKQTPLLNSHSMDDTEDVSEEENDDGMISSERSSDETPVPLPKKLKVKKLDSPEYKDSAGSSRNGSILTWKTHKKKRSSFTVLDLKGQSSGGKSK